MLYVLLKARLPQALLHIIAMVHAVGLELTYMPAHIQEDGFFQRILVPEGQQVPVGTPVVRPMPGWTLFHCIVCLELMPVLMRRAATHLLPVWCIYWVHLCWVHSYGCKGKCGVDISHSIHAGHEGTTEDKAK